MTLKELVHSIVGAEFTPMVHRIKHKYEHKKFYNKQHHVHFCAEKLQQSNFIYYNYCSDHFKVFKINGDDDDDDEIIWRRQTYFEHLEL